MPAWPVPAGAEWSSHGDWVTCSAVGEGIVSTFVKGEEDQERFGDDDVYPEDPERDSWAVWSGTSFAAPQIAAHIATKCRDDDVTPQAAVDCPVPDGQSTCGRVRDAVRPAPGHATQPVIRSAASPEMGDAGPITPSYVLER